ncbi:MAG TPA: cation:proton antiporter [Ramlibacter sp.]|jgi:CPA2 family monovalent cation:H+ antiporter-2|nr:cation:proton antiporter [Ramlibacter sp.]
MDHALPLPYLRETLLFLALVGILIPLLQRLRVNQVIGFLVAGALLGPHGAGRLAETVPALAGLSVLSFPQADGVQALADLGVIFLMFLIGLELSVARVLAMKKWVFGAGTLQVLLSALAIGALAYGFGNSLAASVVLGFVLSLSSTAVVAQLLTQSRAMATPLGQASFSVLMLQDLAVVPLLVLVDLLGRKSGIGIGERLGTTALLSVLVIGAIVVLGRPLIRWLFRTLAKHHQPEVFTALTLLVVLGIGGATAAAGLSMPLGALLAGLLLAETEYRHEVEITIEPFKGLLMGLFFVAVGMAIDLREVLRQPLLIMASVAGLLVIKSTVAAAVLHYAGLPRGQALEAGMLLGQGGEFAFIVIGAATVNGTLDAATGQFMFLVVSLSLLATPPFARLGHRIGAWVDATFAAPTLLREPELPAAAGHVVIIGFGRVGHMLADVFTAQQVPWLAVEQDMERVSALRARGFPVYYGNAGKPELVRKLELAQAACLVVTMDAPAAAQRVVHTAREQAPHLQIFARAHDERHAHELQAAGATKVIPEMLEAGLLLAGDALASVGVQAAEVDAILDAERKSRGRRPASAAPV